MNALLNKRIVLGISGAIAAYKSAELLRRLREHGAEVRVVMTRASCEFITPLTLQALSGRPVHTEFLDHDSESGMGHIELARWSDVILVAPASADIIARLAHGLADDLLTTLCLAADVPLLVAPAMNRQMWLNLATQTNIEIIESRGIKLLGPAEGAQACGETGPGRMLEVGELLQGIESVFRSALLQGRRIMVTAGPTREAIDPARFISNRSSGRMGFAVAQAALEAGADVTLVSGPVTLTAPERARCIFVKSAAEMREAVLSGAGNMDIFISAAAVADYRCAQIAAHKIKKSGATLSLKLEETPDILAEVAGLASPPFTLGFAAETESLKKNALLKLRRKGLDMIAANLVGEKSGFESEDNALELFWSDGSETLKLASKEKIARQLIRIMAARYNDKYSNRIH
ncbi:MAG: bifunctional phosphopantothenoylcysteine decarboxylase/phosphopantothenate--cysteine ligase CoaBC [Gammaproteobacteria bacterium]